MVLTWFAVYKNGDIHKYRPETYNIANIDIQKLDKIVLILEGADQMPFLITHFDDPRKRPIYVRRVELAGGPHPGFTVICHIIGWQMKVSGENIQNINYVFETDGRVEVMEQENAKGEVERIHTKKEKYWIESAGKFDRNRVSWFKEPSEKQLKIIGSKAS